MNAPNTAPVARIPVVRELLTDTDTPLSTYLKLAAGPGSYLLESVQGGEQWGRYSFIGLPCRTFLRVTGQRIEVHTDGVLTEAAEVDDPLAFIEAYRERFQAPDLPGLPRFSGGLVGYFGYDTVRYIEPRLGPSTKPDPIGTPDVLLMLSDELVVFDNLRASVFLIVHAEGDSAAAHQAATERLDALQARLREPLGWTLRELPVEQAGEAMERFDASFTQAGYEAAVRRIKEYIVAGDVMQVVPSQRMSIDFDAPPIELYRALRYTNPSPYMYFLDCGDFQVVGASPEVLVRVDANEVTVRPIAGTRPRGATREEDVALAQELTDDPKEIAEHLMLIDLGRNDVGRVSRPGTVDVNERMVIERYSHVMHIVSNVRGQLRAGLGPIDALRATFPAGTLSGAPKIRALEIIDELEPVKRGVYSGAVGYIDWSGNMDTAIAIRTAVVKDGRLHVQAGGGIVADSVPRAEWEETINKRRALFRAVAMVESARADTTDSSADAEVAPCS
ncbi:MAG: anthranilate synthase component I [Pseudomonadota bacterium]|nr:anthranilate synthase component I [Pseudomonadota bacterium]